MANHFRERFPRFRETLSKNTVEFLFHETIFFAVIIPRFLSVEQGESGFFRVELTRHIPHVALKAGQESEQIRRFRERLPALLAFLPRLQRDMKAISSLFDTREDAFALLYRQRAWDYRSEEYRLMEKKLYHIFGERLPEARKTLTDMIRHTYRASSPDENVNGRLRVFMNARRGVPSWQLPLYQMFLNRKKAKRSRRTERIGTSPLERLTGQSHPNFLDALLGPPNYILSAR